MPDNYDLRGNTLKTCNPRTLGTKSGISVGGGGRRVEPLY